jgi:hypothetical protein
VLILKALKKVFDECGDADSPVAPWREAAARKAA